MQNEQLLNQVTAAIIKAVNLYHVDSKTITAETSLREGGLELDSIDLLEVIVTIENKYGIKVPNAEIGKKYFRTVGTITQFVEENWSKK
jgi:acyl carrier protein